VNEATPEFEAISSDAARMSSDISGSPLTLNVEDLASPEINKVAEDAAAVKAQVEGSPITITFVPVEIPPLPVVDTTPIQESLNEVGTSATAMGENVRAGGSSFTEMGAYAEATEVKLTTVARAIGSVGMMGSSLMILGTDFGIVDKETAKYMHTIIAVITVVSALARMKAYLSLVTTGETATVAVEGATTTATTGALSLSTIAHNIYAAACQFATACENALNISHATFLALCGVGIGVIIAAAAAISMFASQMNNATESIKNYNAAAAETPTKTRGIQRAGEEAMYRRGVE
jgi:protein-S-isoprenylcysteine O-methyltransferase Ste14